jgi:two-component sensor histidine kinase
MSELNLCFRRALPGIDDWRWQIKFTVTAFAVAIATIIELPDSFDAPGKPFLLYFIVSVLCTLAFGVRAGLLAIAASATLSTIFFDPVFSFWVSNPKDVADIAVFAAIGSINVLTLAWIKAANAADVRSREQQTSRLLLSEMAHRVANNFASVISIVGRTSAAIHDADAKRTLEDALNQLRIFASIHNQLRPGRDGDLQVDSKEFIGGLCAALEKTIGERAHLSFEHAATSIPLQLPQAVALGLIINELVTNSAKYAFLDSHGGTIIVTLVVREWDCHLCVADNGTSKAAGLRGSGRGLKLVNGLAQQLSGGFSIHTSPQGTRGEVRFPLPKGRSMSARE